MKKAPNLRLAPLLLYLLTVHIPVSFSSHALYWLLSIPARLLFRASRCFLRAQDSLDAVWLRVCAWTDRKTPAQFLADARAAGIRFP